MCKRQDCDRHEYDYGLCLPHLKEQWLADGTLVLEDKRTEHIDAVEVMTTDNTDEMETRETE